MNLLILFIILNVVNVVIQTIKSLATVKCGKSVAAIVNAMAYGLYTVVIVYTNCDLELWAKVLVVACSNLIGVYVVKLIEEKMRKDKLWKIEFTVKNDEKKLAETFHETLKQNNISHNYIDIGKYTLFNCYCPDQKSSAIVKKYTESFGAKYFATETKLL